MYWSWVLTVVGLSGFILAGRKVWWCWYVNIACQGLWFAYALVSKQYGFIVASIAYTIVFSQNALKWTRDKRKIEELMKVEREIVERLSREYNNRDYTGSMLHCCGEHFPNTKEAIAIHEANGNCNWVNQGRYKGV